MLELRLSHWLDRIGSNSVAKPYEGAVVLMSSLSVRSLGLGWQRGADVLIHAHAVSVCEPASRA